MIKTIISETLEVLDQQVNAVMKAMQKNLPVRTETFIEGGVVVHKATIFYDEPFPYVRNAAPEVIDKARMVQEVGRKEEPKEFVERGALWTHPNGDITGEYKKIKVALDKVSVQNLKDNGWVNVTVNGEELHVIKNQFRKNPKAPDYVMLPPRKNV